MVFSWEQLPLERDAVCFYQLRNDSNYTYAAESWVISALSAQLVYDGYANRAIPGLLAERPREPLCMLVFAAYVYIQDHL